MKFDLWAGTTEFYVDAEYYDHEFKDRRSDVAWYTERYLEAEGLVLELGVGTGRTALRAVRQGAQVLGMDLSQTMLERCDARREKLPKARRGDLKLVRGDMRDFAFGRQFPVISCPFNAFQHLYSREDADACLQAVRAHLEPDGLFLIDVLLPDLDYLTRSPFKRYPGIRFKHPVYDSWYTYSEQSAYDAVHQISQMWFHYDKTDPDPGAKGPEHKCIQLSHRCFFPGEMEALLHHNGFEMLQRYGDFELGDLRADSESQVILAGLR